MGLSPGLAGCLDGSEGAILHLGLAASPPLEIWSDVARFTLQKVVRVGEAENPGPEQHFEHVDGEMDMLIERSVTAGRPSQPRQSLGGGLEPPVEEDTIGSQPSLLRLFAEQGDGAWDEYLRRVTARPTSDADGRLVQGPLRPTASARVTPSPASPQQHPQPPFRPRAGRRRPPPRTMAIPLTLQHLITAPTIQETDRHDARPTPPAPDSIPHNPFSFTFQTRLQGANDEHGTTIGASSPSLRCPPPRQEGKRSAEHRPRGGRSGRRGSDAIVTMNTQGQPQLDAAHAEVLRGDPAIVALAVQEHHARRDAYVDLQHRARSGGWQLHGAQARIALEGPAAGAAVSVRRDRAFARPLSGTTDQSPTASPGSLAAVWADVAIPGGLLVLSMYLYNSEVGSERNVQIVTAALALAKSHGGMWILCGDMNCTPTEFTTHYGWLLERASSRLATSGEPTMFPGVG